MDLAAPRLIYNCDADNIFIYADPPMQAEQVQAYVDQVAAAGVTSFFMCPNYGMVMNFPGGLNEMMGEGLSPARAAEVARVAARRPCSLERGAANLGALVAAGHDPLGLVLARARERGLETFITFRLNEVHCADDPDSLILSRFWREHPELHLGRITDALPPLYGEILSGKAETVVGSWLPAGLNFALPQVRARRLAELRELCERYPVDGLDLDFQRFPMYFRPGEEVANTATMTGWLHEVRTMTREVGESRGRPLLLTARVMARPEQTLGLGLDFEAWAQEHLLDALTISHFLRNDFALPVGDYRRRLPAGFPLWASIEVAPDRDTYRRLAADLWAQGVQGIMLFNFFTTREEGREPPWEVIRDLLPAG